MCVNVAADKNFEADVRDKVCFFDRHFSQLYALIVCVPLAGFSVYPSRGEGDDSDVAAESVSGSHSATTTLCLAYPIQRLRLQQYQDLLKETP